MAHHLMVQDMQMSLAAAASVNFGIVWQAPGAPAQAAAHLLTFEYPAQQRSPHSRTLPPPNTAGQLTQYQAVGCWHG